MNDIITVWMCSHKHKNLAKLESTSYRTRLRGVLHFHFRKMYVVDEKSKQIKENGHSILIKILKMNVFSVTSSKY